MICGTTYEINIMANSSVLLCVVLAQVRSKDSDTEQHVFFHAFDGLLSAESVCSHCRYVTSSVNNTIIIIILKNDTKTLTANLKRRMIYLLSQSAAV